MVKIVQMNTISTGRIRMNLTERLVPLGSCHTDCCSPDSVDASNSGLSAGVSLAGVIIASRLVAFVEPVKHRQPD